MTDYTYSKDYNCKTCGTRFSSADGKNCDCDFIGKCMDCGGEGIPEKIVYNCYEHETDVSILKEEIAQLESQNKALVKKNVALTAEVGMLRAYKDVTVKLIETMKEKIRELGHSIQLRDEFIGEVAKEIKPFKEVH